MLTLRSGDCSVPVSKGDVQRVRGEPDRVRQLHHGRGRRQLDLRQGLHPPPRGPPLLLHLRQRLLPARHEDHHHRPPAPAQRLRPRQEPWKHRRGGRLSHGGAQQVDDRRVDGGARCGRDCRLVRFQALLCDLLPRFLGSSDRGPLVFPSTIFFCSKAAFVYHV
jgi:hypothetical protein